MGLDLTGRVECCLLGPLQLRILGTGTIQALATMHLGPSVGNLGSKRSITSCCHCVGSS